MKNDVVAVHMLDPGVIFVRLQQYIISISNRRALNIFSPIKSDNSKVFTDEVYVFTLPLTYWAFETSILLIWSRSRVGFNPNLFV